MNEDIGVRAKELEFKINFSSHGASSAPDSPSASPSLEAWQRIRNSLRPGQQQMADWQGGSLAVSAVPGAGKSTGMAAATALAIARYQLHG